MKNHVVLASVATLALLAACGRNDGVKDTTLADNTATSSDGYGVDETAAKTEDQEFVTKAALASLTEIRAGEIAEMRAQRPEVRSLGETLVSDHKAASEKLKAAAGTEYTIPVALDETQQAKIDDINNSDADSFDRDYLDLQEEAHEQAVALFEDYSLNGDDPELKAFASATLPTLRGHLDHVRHLREGFDVGDDAMGLGSGEADSNPDQPDETANEPN